MVTTNISMSILNGLEAAEWGMGAGSTAKIISITVHTDPEFVSTAFQVGAMGFVTKARLALDLNSGHKDGISAATLCLTASPGI